jgi:hypothetical protein
MKFSDNGLKRCWAVFTGGYNKIFHRYEIRNFLGSEHGLCENK